MSRVSLLGRPGRLAVAVIGLPGAGLAVAAAAGYDEVVGVGLDPW